MRDIWCATPMKGSGWLAEIGDRVGIGRETVESCQQRIQSFRQTKTEHLLDH